MTLKTLKTRYGQVRTYVLSHDMATLMDIRFLRKRLRK